MGRLEFKKHNENYEINLFWSKNSKSHYRNIVDKDHRKLAQIFIDLQMEGFPVEKAVKLFLNRIRNQDWLGLS